MAESAVCGRVGSAVSTSMDSNEGLSPVLPSSPRAGSTKAWLRNRGAGSKCGLSSSLGTACQKLDPYTGMSLASIHEQVGADCYYFFFM